MIRRLIYWVLLLFVCMGAHAQFGDSPSRGLGPDSSASAKRRLLVSTIRFSEYG